MSSIESPCVRNCCLDDQDICLGCFRSMQEIIQWRDLTDEEKTAILKRAHYRKEIRNEQYGRSFQ